MDLTDLLYGWHIVLFLLTHGMIDDGAVEHVTPEKLLGVLLFDHAVIVFALKLASLFITFLALVAFDLMFIVSDMQNLIQEHIFVQVLPEVLA